MFSRKENKMIDWDNVEMFVDTAKGIAFDTCHKIYVLMDDRQVELMREYEYDEIRTADQMTKAEMFDTLKKWYAESCGLKFISAVETTSGDANDGFTTLVEQGATDREPCEDCLSDYCGGECEWEEDEEEDEDE
jgi:hypothetical protein